MREGLRLEFVGISCLTRFVSRSKAFLCLWHSDRDCLIPSHDFSMHFARTLAAQAQYAYRSVRKKGDRNVLSTRQYSADAQFSLVSLSITFVTDASEPCKNMKASVKSLFEVCSALCTVNPPVSALHVSAKNYVPV